MTPELEKELWARIKKQPTLQGETPRQVIADFIARGLIQSPKQAWATLNKWTDKGLYNWGVNEDLGWIEDGAVYMAKNKAPARGLAQPEANVQTALDNFTKAWRIYLGVDVQAVADGKAAIENLKAQHRALGRAISKLE